jgi:serine/threonine protein kinase
VSDSALPIAVLADRYTIERELGRGGMATVYLAPDDRHQRPVAVKVLRPDLAATLASERFLREIRIAANLQHPHIITLFDSGTHGAALYHVMPYVEGMSLRSRLATGPIPVPDVMRYLRDVFDALAYAHAHGVVHRDVKPENIMISARHALVVDFGIAKAMSAAAMAELSDDGETLTQVGTSLGTPAYMAPEQAAGDPNVNHAADLYAAGVVAYEMLAGRPPFGGSPREVLAAHISQSPAPVGLAAPHAPPALAALVMRCLEKDPANRPASADDALASIEAMTSPNVGAPSLPPGPGGCADVPARRSVHWWWSRPEPPRTAGMRGCEATAGRTPSRFRRFDGSRTSTSSTARSRSRCALGTSSETTRRSRRSCRVSARMSCSGRRLLAPASSGRRTMIRRSGRSWASHRPTAFAFRAASADIASSCPGTTPCSWRG